MPQTSRDLAATRRTLVASCRAGARAFPGELSRALRSLRRSPGFVAISVASLGIAIGLSSAVFSLIDTMTHPTVPYANAKRLYSVRLEYGNRKNLPSPVERTEAMRSIAEVDAVAAYRYTVTTAEVGSERLGDGGLLVTTSPSYFEILGFTPRVGRLPTPSEIEAGASVVVSDAIWRKWFANRKAIGDARIAFGGRDYAIVGVMPQSRYVSGTAWLPAPSEERVLAGRAGLIVRLREGVTRLQLRPTLAAIAARFTAANSPGKPYLLSIVSVIPDPLRIRDYHGAMIGAAVGILIIACFNVGALMLARGVTRRRDFALRLALGASRASLARELFAEVTLLTLAGGIVGAVVAIWGVGAFTSIIPEQFMWLGFVEPKWSWRVFLEACAAMFASIAVAGGLPAWNAAHVQPSEPLKESAGTTTGRIDSKFRWLVIGELALSMVLLIGASLITKATRNIANFDFGYDARSLIGVHLNVAADRGTIVPSGERLPLMNRTVAVARATPGIVSAALMGRGHVEGELVISDRTIEGRGGGLSARHGYVNAGPGFFSTMRIPIVDGRDFVEGDRAGAGAVILDQSAAKALFPNGGAIGRRVKLGDMQSKQPWLMVVGVVRNAKLGLPQFPELEPEPQVYATVADSTSVYWTVVARPEATAKRASIDLQRALRATMPPRGYAGAFSWVENFDSEISSRAFLARVFVALGVASLALAAAGLFSVLSYAVGQRMREFAVRVALGARPADLRRLVLRSAAEFALGGTAIGAFLGMWGGQLLDNYLYNMGAADVESLLIAEGILISVTMAASLVPAIRATRANPVDVLRAT